MGSMFSKVSYDQIYDEHIYMFSIISIQKIFKIFDFELIDVLPQGTHGGSMRYIVARKNQRSINKRVHDGLRFEKEKKFDDEESCLKFKIDCEKSKKNIILDKAKYKDMGKSIAGYAATSKSTTILNYCNINNSIIDFICDTTKDKIGKYSPGMHIPIVATSEFKNNFPDIAYLFAWNHKKEIFSKESNFSDKGGKWFSHVTL